MNRAVTKFILVLLVLPAVLSAGCAQVVHKVDVLYSPQSSYRGGTGLLQLAVSNGSADCSPDASIRWVLGKIMDSEGNATGEIVSSIRPQDIVVDAFKQELGAAGYQISSPKQVDKYTEKGVVLTGISVKLEEVPSLAKLKSSCTLLVKMDLWKNGVVVKRSEYSSILSDVAVVDRELLPRSLFQKAIQDIMFQALPDIIRNLQ